MYLKRRFKTLQLDGCEFNPVNKPNPKYVINNTRICCSKIIYKSIKLFKIRDLNNNKYIYIYII